MPPLETLGDDLLATTRRQCRLALARPFLGVAAFALAAYAGLWWITPLIVFLVFVAVVTVTHDVVHGSLGLSRVQTEWALFAMGAVLLESGHAYRATHLRHHQFFPGPDDPEGDPARMSLLKAVLWGPLFLPRLWCWSYARSKPGGSLRRWLVAEAAWALAVPTLGSGSCPGRPLCWFTPRLSIVGSWVYPLLTVHLPHRDYGDTPLSQTHTLRGRIVPSLFLELTYHLEHHLYPEVPSHNLPELSGRLEPLLRQAGVQTQRSLTLHARPTGRSAQLKAFERAVREAVGEPLCLRRVDVECSARHPGDDQVVSATHCIVRPSSRGLWLDSQALLEE